MADAGFEQRVAAVRCFTRFYTQKIGVLQEGLLQSPYSLTESRVLYELANRGQPTATELCRTSVLIPAISAASPPLRKGRAHPQADIEVRCEAEPHFDHRQGPQGVRPAQRAFTRRGRDDA